MLLAGVPGLARLRRLARPVLPKFPSLNFITLHYIYFLATCLITSVIFWGASTPARSVSYTDSLFLVVSAMSLAGLNTVNLSTLNTFQQFMLFALIMMGSAVFVSAFVVQARKRAFEKRFAYVVAERRRRRRLSNSLVRRLSRSLSRANVAEPEQDVGRPAQNVSEPADQINSVDATADTDAISTTEKTALDSQHRPQTRSISSEAGDEIMVNPSAHENPQPRIVFDLNTHFHAEGGVEARATVKRRLTGNSNVASEYSHYSLEPSANHLPFASSGYLSRNSHFHHLSEEERQKLGGYEYRAVCLLSWLVPVYFILFQLFGCIGLGAYVAINRPSLAFENGLNPWWVGAFNAVSAFNNSGMSLLDANMVAFQTSTYMLLTMGMLILAGNTCYPIFLRLIVWTMFKLLPNSEVWDDHRKTLRFLLDHPRRCYTNMFPSQHTWWLLACVVCLNGIDWVAFEILNIGNSLITSLPAGTRVIDGLFQALAIRSGGFYVVPILNVRISLQVLYVIMMYISVYPVVITMRNSNVYEERSLGIYTDEESNFFAAENRTQQSPPKSGFFRTFSSSNNRAYFVRHQLHAQLAHDLWWPVLAIFLIMIIEGSSFARDPTTYSVFNVIFEIFSAFGTVGVSVGLTDQAYSFSGALRTLSKLILCVIMLRGRHRGLPVAIDKAIMLPGDEMDEREEEDAERRIGVAMERTLSRGTAFTTFSTS